MKLTGKQRTQKGIDMGMKWWGRRTKVRLHQAPQAFKHWSLGWEEQKQNLKWITDKDAEKTVGWGSNWSWPTLWFFSGQPCLCYRQAFAWKIYNLRCCGLSLFHREVKVDRKAWGELSGTSWLFLTKGFELYFYSFYVSVIELAMTHLSFQYPAELHFKYEILIGLKRLI